MAQAVVSILVGLLVSTSAFAGEYLPDMSGLWIIESTVFSNGITVTDRSEPTTMDNGLDYYLPNFKCNGHNACEARFSEDYVLRGTVHPTTVRMSGDRFDAYEDEMVTDHLTVAWGRFEGKDFVTVNRLEYSKETGDLTAIGTTTFHRP